MVNLVVISIVDMGLNPTISQSHDLTPILGLPVDQISKPVLTSSSWFVECVDIRLAPIAAYDGWPFQLPCDLIDDDVYHYHYDADFAEANTLVSELCDFTR